MRNLGALLAERRTAVVGRERELALLRAWWAAVPEAFRVARSPRGQVVAFALLCELGRVSNRLLARDPLCGVWQRHLRAHPVPRGQRVLLARLVLAHGTGFAPSPCFAALLRDLERESLETGAVRRIYSGAGDDKLLAQLAPLGYVAIGPHPPRAIVCDLGPESVAGWLSTLAARDLDVQTNALDEDARELRLEDGRCVALTKLEGDVLRYLQEREDQVVERSALLRDVWGYEWNGGANAMDVAISGLRRKLGPQARALETVRGVGFRLRAF